MRLEYFLVYSVLELEPKQINLSLFLKIQLNV